MLKRDVKKGERIDFEYNGERVGYMIITDVIGRAQTVTVVFHTDDELRVWHNVKRRDRSSDDDPC